MSYSSHILFTHTTQIRVRYAETDQMRYVYYGNYATYFEVARVEALRALGIRYKDLEDSGVMMPVVELKTRFIRAAVYDDLLTIKLRIPSMPSARIIFEYEVYNEGEVLLTKGETTLVFVSTETGKVVACPQTVLHALKPYYAI